MSHAFPMPTVGRNARGQQDIRMRFSLVANRIELSRADHSGRNANKRSCPSGEALQSNEDCSSLR
jgi:hypothetical protein